MRRPPPRPRFGRPPVLYTHTGQQTKSWQTEKANLGTASAAAVTAGAGATREAREAAGAGLVGSTTISIFMGRSVEQRHRRSRRGTAGEKVDCVISWLFAAEDTIKVERGADAQSAFATPSRIVRDLHPHHGDRTGEMVREAMMMTSASNFSEPATSA